MNDLPSIGSYFFVEPDLSSAEARSMIEPIPAEDRSECSSYQTFMIVNPFHEKTTLLKLLSGALNRRHPGNHGTPLPLLISYMMRIRSWV